MPPQTPIFWWPPETHTHSWLPRRPRRETSASLWRFRKAPADRGTLGPDLTVRRRRAPSPRPYKPMMGSARSHWPRCVTSASAGRRAVEIYCTPEPISKGPLWHRQKPPTPRSMKAKVEWTTPTQHTRLERPRVGRRSRLKLAPCGSARPAWQTESLSLRRRRRACARTRAAATGGTTPRARGGPGPAPGT